jgi:hypothetical protein
MNEPIKKDATYYQRIAVAKKAEQEYAELAKDRAAYF